MRLFGTNLKRIRTQRKLTQGAMAEASGLSERMAREMELGNRAPSFRSLGRLSKVLGVQPHEFFLPVEGAERYDRRKLLGQLKDEVQKEIEKRFDKYLE